MAYTTQNGEVGDAAFRNQTTNALAGNYVIDGCGVALGGSTTSIETSVAAGVVNFGNQPIEVTNQTVTHPDGDATHPRVDAVTVNQNGTAGRIVGTPAAADPSNRRFPRVRTPTLPAVPDDNLLVVGALWVPAGATASSDLFDDYVTPRELVGGGLNDLQLIPGRDLQYVLDNAREGEVLRGDRSTTITLPGPLTVTTPNVTIRGVTLRFADNAAASDTDDMLTLAADNVTVENVTLDGNKGGQPNVVADGINIEASGCTVENVRTRNLPGYGVNVNGGSTAVEDTVIRQIIGRDSDRDVVLVQGTNALRTTIETVRGLRLPDRNTGSVGAVCVRNGATATRVSNVYAEDAPCVVRIQDFGSSNSATAPVIACFMDSIRANNVARLIHNQTETGTGHRGFFFSRLAGRNFAPSNLEGLGGGLVDVSGWSDVKITNSALSTPNMAGAWSIYGENAYQVTMINVTTNNDAPGRGCIGFFDTPYLSLGDGVACQNSPGYGIRVRSTQDSGTTFGTRITDTTTRSIGGTNISLEEASGSTMNGLIVKNNFSGGNIADETTGADKFFGGNI